jgi:hypothetical protein
VWFAAKDAQKSVVQIFGLVQIFKLGASESARQGVACLQQFLKSQGPSIFPIKSQGPSIFPIKRHYIEDFLYKGTK